MDCKGVHKHLLCRMPAEGNALRTLLRLPFSGDDRDFFSSKELISNSPYQAHVFRDLIKVSFLRPQVRRNWAEFVP